MKRSAILSSKMWWRIATGSAPARNTHKHIFIGGLHRSGTSLLHQLLVLHPDISGFSGTGVPEDEGQHLQDLYPSARVFGGPGCFAFESAAHLTENDLPLVKACKAGLWQSWAPHWDLSKPILVEKSPTNIIRSRFLQAVFPGAMFIFIIRHPLAVSAATQKWAKKPTVDLVRHWIKAHQVFLEDLTHVQSWAWFRYEDLAAHSDLILAELFKFLSLAPIKAALPVQDRNSDYFRAAPQDVGDAAIEGKSIVEFFGYKLGAPYYELAPGGGHLHMSSAYCAPESS